MSRRITLPGADELFRATGEGAMGGIEPVDAVVVGQTGSPSLLAGTPPPLPALESADDGLTFVSAGVRQTAVRPRPRSAGERRPSGRERHDEKITVYVSAAELMDLEHARLALRGDHGLAVDRGRMVREALAVVIADFEARGDESILVRRLRGR